MSLAFKTFSRAARLIFQDKLVMLYCLLPIAIGMAAFYFLFDWMFGSVRAFGMEYIQGLIKVSGITSQILNVFISALLGLIFYFVLNICFVLLVSLVACPFNDLISTRIESRITNKSVSTIGFVAGIVNEVKKLGIISGFSLCAFLLGLSTILLPVSIMIWAYLMSASFIDYSWCRNDLDWGECLANIRRNYFSYGIAGGVFILGFSIPIVNVLLLPYAVVYFTVLYIEGNR